MAFTLSFPSIGRTQIKCEALFKPTFTQNLVGKLSHYNPFVKKQKLQLTQDEVMHLTELFKAPDFIKPYGLGRGEKEGLFLMMWHDLPEAKKAAVIKVLDDSPAEFKKIRAHLTETFKRHNIEAEHSNTFFDLVINNYTDYLNFATPAKKFSEWLKGNTDYFEAKLNSGEFNLHALRTQLKEGLVKKQIGDRWLTSAGVYRLPMLTDNTGQLRVTLKSGASLRAVMIDSNTIKIEAPRSMVGRAAWNPLYSAVLQAKISAGTKPPEVYDGFLATNEVFYLTDGNHRFASVETREKVWIKMSAPARTASMSISFDAIGLSQPSIEILMDYFNGKLTLEDMIGGANAARILYR